MLPHSRSPRPRASTGRSGPRRALAALGVGSLTVAVTASLTLVGTGPSGAAPDDVAGGRGPARSDAAPGLPADLSAALNRGQQVPQTSDGVPGARVAPESRSERAARTITNTVTSQWQVAPGVWFARFDRNDSLRGNVRGQLLVLDQATPGLSVDYTGPKSIAKVQTVDRLTARGGGIAGINGDFFDIGDTGASLGVGSGRGTGLLKGPQSGWNSSFSIDAAGVAHIGELPVVTSIKKHARMKVDGLNPPSVPSGGIAAYDKDWGRTLNGFQVAEQQKKRVRVVEVRGGRVRSNRTSLSSKLKIRGKVLIGRGKGADKLRKLAVGSRSGVVSGAVGSPPVAISGNKILLLNKIRQVVDDTEMHPRTAIGIDRDTNRLLMLVVDGRQTFSRGMTMVELSQLMAELGADDALNLDGGGSSTMMALDQAGVMGVQNSPSDGSLRKVANGLVVDYAYGSPLVPYTPPTLFPPPAPPVTPTATPTPTPPGPSITLTANPAG